MGGCIPHIPVLESAIHKPSAAMLSALVALCWLGVLGSSALAQEAAQEASPRATEKKDTKAARKPGSANKLSYHDGSADGKRSIAGAAELISFTLPAEEAKVAAIRIHGSRYGHPQAPKEDFSIYFLNQDMSETIAKKTAPYGRFKRGQESWVEIKFSDPVEVPKEFWVGVDFRAERTKGVYVSFDKSTDGSHSRIGTPGGKTRDAGVEGDWMIEVVLDK